MGPECRLQAHRNARIRADFSPYQGDNLSRKAKTAMKFALTWGADKCANSCRLKSSMQPSGETQPLVGRQMPHSKYNVLVVDDDLNLTRLMATILRTSGIEALTALDGYAAL